MSLLDPHPGDAAIVLTWPIKRIMGKGSKAMSKLGLETVEDLLRYYPRRYLHPAEETRIESLPMGELVSLIAEVKVATTRQMRARRGKMLNVTVTDGECDLDLTFFSAYGHEERLRPGFRGMFIGTMSVYRGRRQLAHPQYRPVIDETADRNRMTHPRPVYPATAALDTWAIEKVVELALDTVGEVPEQLDPLPRQVRQSEDLIGLGQAWELVHRPTSRGDYLRAQARLRFEEAFVLQTVLAQRRLVAQAVTATARPATAGGIAAAFDERLPFTLTAGQVAVGAEIDHDLSQAHPMHRLLQGEVGSGKTMVALRAMLQVVDAGGQAALLAPTEVLAAQHYASICSMLGDLAQAGQLGGDARGTQVALLTGSQNTSARRKAMLAAASGDAGIVIGTHALLQDKVEFFDLGLVVIDEQHRFGVEQRDALRGKGVTVPHLLVMTATPIPRTVAMTVFGDLNVSTLTELPAGRAPIQTHVVALAEKPGWYDRIFTRIAEECAKEHQVYVVCPRIGDGEEPSPGDDEAVPMRGVLEVLEDFRSRPELAGLRIEALHGRMPTAEREAVMAAFDDGDVNVLVATTVIEVGVDVPNSTVMVILDADRFGVSQLHQLRGRVGRGAAGGLCLLVTNAEAGSPSRDRLDAVAATLDGFELARVDLEQRREGDVLGAAQSGSRSSLRLLRVLKHEKVIERAREVAVQVVEADPELKLPENVGLAGAVFALAEAERLEYLDRA